MTLPELRNRFNARFECQVSESALHMMCLRRGIQAGGDGRFVPGHATWNKGIYMRNSRRTEFKKGNKPQNHLPVGSERVAKDSIIQIKIAEPNKWRSKHSLIYEREHGPIPKSHVVIFLDGDKRNFDPANLFCVSRSELVRLNEQRYSKQHPEIKPALINLVKIEVSARELSK
jgi:hypothetical protein